MMTGLLEYIELKELIMYVLYLQAIDGIREVAQSRSLICNKVFTRVG